MFWRFGGLNDSAPGVAKEGEHKEEIIYRETHS